MVSKSQKIRLGIFITIATFILLTTIVILSRNQLFKEQDIYHITYKNISVLGLNVGSSVKYLGINIGKIKDIRIDPNDVNSIIVTISLKKGTPVKNDVRADISAIGITGLKTIELRGGSNKAPLLAPEGFIKPGSSLTEDITGKAEIIAEKIEVMLNNVIRLTTDQNQDKIFGLLDEASLAVSEFNSLFKSSRPKLERSLRNLDSSMVKLSAASSSANYSLTTVEDFIASDSVRATLRNISQIADKLNKANIYHIDQQINLAVDTFNDLLNRMDLILKYNITTFNSTMEDLNETARYLNSAARKIDEDPSVLLGGNEPENPPDEELEQ